MHSARQINAAAARGLCASACDPGSSGNLPTTTTLLASTDGHAQGICRRHQTPKLPPCACSCHTYHSGSSVAERGGLARCGSQRMHAGSVAVQAACHSAPLDIAPSSTTSVRSGPLARSPSPDRTTSGTHAVSRACARPSNLRCGEASGNSRHAGILASPVLIAQSPMPAVCPLSIGNNHGQSAPLSRDTEGPPQRGARGTSARSPLASQLRSVPGSSPEVRTKDMVGHTTVTNGTDGGNSAAGAQGRATWRHHAGEPCVPADDSDVSMGRTEARHTAPRTQLGMVDDRHSEEDGVDAARRAVRGVRWPSFDTVDSTLTSTSVPSAVSHIMPPSAAAAVAQNVNAGCTADGVATVPSGGVASASSPRVSCHGMDILAAVATATSNSDTASLSSHSLSPDQASVANDTPMTARDRGPAARSPSRSPPLHRRRTRRSPPRLGSSPRRQQRRPGALQLLGHDSAHGDGNDGNWQPPATPIVRPFHDPRRVATPHVPPRPVDVHGRAQLCKETGCRPPMPPQQLQVKREGDAPTRAKNFTSTFHGVSWHKRSQRWAVQIRHNGKRVHVGYFKEVRVGTHSCSQCCIGVPCSPPVILTGNRSRPCL